MAARRVQEALRRAVPDVELAEPVRQRVVEQRVLGIHPLAEHLVAVVQQGQQRTLVGLGPLLEEVELALAPAGPLAVQVVAARLQQQLAVAGKAQRGVGAVELFLDDDVPAGQPLIGHGVVLVAGLQARAAQVRRTGVLEDLDVRKKTRAWRNGWGHVVLSKSDAAPHGDMPWSGKSRRRRQAPQCRGYSDSAAWPVVAGPAGCRRGRWQDCRGRPQKGRSAASPQKATHRSAHAKDIRGKARISV
ncbi:hypothetical protein GY15_24665 [Delftia sp. 670]|nr:hypothetical protein GY15_24665 [Delftia sp. 670]